MKTFTKIFMYLLLTIMCYVGKAQSMISGIWIGNARPAFSAFIGWDGTGPNTGSLDIRNDFTQPINFFTAGTQQMTITFAGLVGVGTAPPANLFEISGGS